MAGSGEWGGRFDYKGTGGSFRGADTALYHNCGVVTQLYVFVEELYNKNELLIVNQLYFDLKKQKILDFDFLN